MEEVPHYWGDYWLFWHAWCGVLMISISTEMIRSKHAAWMPETRHQKQLYL